MVGTTFYMVPRSFICFSIVVGGLLFAACASNSGAPDYCGSPNPCACLAYMPGKTCTAHGSTCVCVSDAEDSGSPDAGGPDDAGPPDMAAFVGRWSPASGSGQNNCGQDTDPNPGAILTFTQDGPNTLTAASSGAGECVLELVVSGETASLAQSSETCAVADGGTVAFNTFNLLFVPAAGTDGGSDGAVDASGEDSGPPPPGTLSWQLGDSDGTCVTTLDYTLVRAE